MLGPEDKRNIDAVRDKLKSIDQGALKNNILQKGTANFVMGQFLK